MGLTAGTSGDSWRVELLNCVNDKWKTFKETYCKNRVARDDWSRGDVVYFWGEGSREMVEQMQREWNEIA
jgi:hypothetical protein